MADAHYWYEVDYYLTNYGVPRAEMLLIKKDEELDRPSFRDRGGYPNHGSGPFFQWLGSYIVADTPVKPFGKAYGEKREGLRNWKVYAYNTFDRWLYAREYFINGQYQYTNYGGFILTEVDGVLCRGYAQQNTDYVRRDDPLSYFMDNFQVSRWLPYNRWKYGVVAGSKMVCKFREYNTFLEICEFQIYTGGCASRFQAAYVDAYNNLPKAATNSMANVVATLDILKDIVTKGPFRALVESFKDLKDPRNAWLSYRYVYTTTKLDIEEYRSFVLRVNQLKTFISGSVSCAGHFSDETGSYRCEMVLPIERCLPTTIVEWLHSCGFNLTATNIWDMIPYSFVVDWFIGVSDLTQYLENWSGALELDPTQIWFTYQNGYDGQFFFYRVPGSRISVPPAYHDVVVSDRTFTMRCADTLSLFSKR